MAERVQHTQQRQESSGNLTTSDLIDRLSRFDGPPEQFLVNLLAVQCYISGAAGGAILRPGAEGRPEVLAIYPALQQGQTAPSWLAQAVEMSPSVASEGETVVRPVHGPEDLYGQPAEHHLVMVPLRAGTGVRGLSVFVSESRDPRELTVCRERIELTSSLLSLYEMRLTLQQRQWDLRRLRMAMETLSAVNEHDRFSGAAMAMCNEVSSRWESDRVSLGFLKGRYVYLKAMSHTEKFSRKMKLVQDVESAMEECLDQDVEILHPAGEQATYVSRATKELSQHHGMTSVLSMPLRRSGQAEGVLMLERPADRPFGLEEVESLRLTCELCTARLSNLHEHDRWVGARAAAASRKGLSKLLGPTHTWVKATVLAAVGAVLFLTLARGDYDAEGTFVIEPVVQQVIQAPYDGTLLSVEVEPPDVVKQGQLLARLDSEALEGELASKEAEHRSLITQRDEMLTSGRAKTSEMRVYEFQAKKVQAEIDVLNYRIGKARLTSPIDGTVISGDLKRQVGTSVQTGQQLFEIAPLETLRATLSIPEDQIADVKDGDLGEVATALYPGRRIGFQVDRVIPVAEVKEQNNVFKVRATLQCLDLQGEHCWLRPGMQGVGKVHLGRKPYAWLWSRRLVNWVRMKLWW